MFDYTKETILNVVDSTLGSGNVVAYAKDGAAAASGIDGDFLMIKKDGNYKHENLMAVYVSEGEAGTPCQLVFTPTISAEAEYMIAFKLLSDQKFQEFASPNWAEFTKPVLVEFVADDAAAACDAIEAGLKLQIGEYITVTNSGSAVTVNFKENWLNVATDSVFVGKEGCATVGCGGDMEAKYEPSTDIAVAYTERVKEFATCNWLLQNYRLPTAANLRYNSANAEEMPSAALYNQYVLKYCTPRFIGGTSVIGENNVSYTNHVFYVPADGTQDAAFEAEVLKVLGAADWTTGDPDEDAYTKFAEKA